MRHLTRLSFRAIAAFFLMAAIARIAGATSYTWNNIAGGYATTSTNWTPNGLPGPLDDVNFNIASNYPVVWQSPVDTVQSLTVVNSQLNFTITGVLGVRFHPLLENNSAIIVYGGRIDGPSWSMIENHSNASITVTGPTSQALALASSTTSPFGSNGGVAGLNILNGGTFQSAGELSFGPNLCSMSTLVQGNYAGQPSLLSTTTTGISGRGWIAVGDYGTATLDLSIGSKLSPGGALFVGRHAGSSGLLELLTDLGQGPTVDARGPLFVGANDEAAVAGGTGLVDSRLGKLSVQGRCWIGDADDLPLADPLNPTARLLVEGGTTVLAGGLTMSPIRSGRLELRAGATHLIGGSADIRQATPFEIGVSTSNSPVLSIESDTTADIWPVDATHPALGVGRGGPGTMHVAYPGTTLTLHGDFVMADSVGGTGTMAVDSAGVFVVQGRTMIGSNGNAQIRTTHGATVTFQDSVVIGAGGPGYATVSATDTVTMHFQKPVRLGSVSYGNMFINNASHMDAPGITLGPFHGGFFTGFSGARSTITDHLDLIGIGFVEVDGGGTLVYSGPRAATVGAGGATMIVSDSSLAQVSPELDVRGLLYMEPSQTSGLVATNGARITQPAHDEAPLYVAGGRLECPLTRMLDNGQTIAVGTIAGRFHIDSGMGELQVSYNHYSLPSHLAVGDSTKTDGFVSVGTTVVALDTLKVLDSDGGDLGKVTIAGGDLQLPRTGHLKSGFLLSGYGTVEGSLDVRDSAWVSLNGTVTGDIALAGTLDVNQELPTQSAPEGTQAIRALSLGTLHVATTGRVALQIGVEQDQITVSGAAVLGGTLDVRTLDGQTPTIGSLFTVLTAGSVTGTFASVTVNGHPNPGTVTVIYGTNNVRVVVVGSIAGVGGGPADQAAPGELRFAVAGGPRNAALALDLPWTASVRVALYDVDGRRVADLAEGELGPGRHRYELARSVPASGMYFARAVVGGAAGARTLTTRVVVLR
jgi:hypothetical protein